VVKTKAKTKTKKTLVSSVQIAHEVAGSRNRFIGLLENTAAQQHDFLLSLLQRNAQTVIGRKYEFSNIRSVEQYQAAVPVVGYEAISEAIESMACGTPDALMVGQALVLEPTGGSGSGGLKLIAYSEQSLVEFQAMVRPWLDDLYLKFPDLSKRSAYWSISPAWRNQQLTQNVVPVGLPTDAHYLGAALGEALFKSLCVPPSVGSIDTHTDWELSTLCHLLADENLGLVSVWSPTFWLDLMHAAILRQTEIVDMLSSHSLEIDISSDRLSTLSASLSKQDFEGVWPHLQVISCWGDAAAAPYIPILQHRFPAVFIQRKGLLATEGAMSFPLFIAGDVPQDLYVHALAIESGFFEFLSVNGGLSKVYLAEELEVGERYSIILTNSSGLYRYAIGDEIEVTDFIGSAPCFRFLGRGGNTVDLCGEKLTENFVSSALVNTFAALHTLFPDAKGEITCKVVVPSGNGKPLGYRLIVDQLPSALSIEAIAQVLEVALKENPQYAYARHIEQLAAIEVEVMTTLPARWLARAMEKGQQLGDVKPPLLVKETAWLEF
jgi:hypothetical protein